MRVSAILCTKNRSAKLQRAVRSILEQSNDGLLEIIIVDQSDRQSRLEFDQEQGRLVKHIRSKTHGLSRARNEGIHASTGEFIAFTDDDCVVAPGWIQGICQSFDQYRELQGVFGRVLAYSPNPCAEAVEHHIDHFVYGSTTYASKNGDFYCMALFDIPHSIVHDLPCLPYANLGSGNNMAYRRSVFNIFGYFVPELGAGTLLGSAEDTEFQYRLLVQHCKLAYLPHILLYHDNWLSLEQTISVQRRYLSGLVALFTWYMLKGDILAKEFLFYTYHEMNCRIAEFRSNHANITYIKYKTMHNLACLKGIVGGAYFALSDKIKHINHSKKL